MMASGSKLRILALHGYMQSDVIFSAKLGSLRKGFKKEIDFTFVRAPHKVPSQDGTGQEDTDENGYGWWFNTEDHVFKARVPSDLCVGFDDSVAVIEKAFLEQGPFDGILGFSQGAAFVCILCAMKKKKILQIEFDFAIIISGFKSLCAPHAKYYDEEIDIPSLHIYGENDQVIPTVMAAQISSLFTNKKEVRHEGGHYVPSKKDIYKDFVMEMLPVLLRCEVRKPLVSLVNSIAMQNENAHQPVAQQQLQGQPKIYRGKAENMVDPNAIARPRGRQQQQPQLPGQRTPGAVDDLARDPVFAHGICVREVNANTRMTPAASSLIEVSRDVYRELITADLNIQKSIVPEYLDYYATALLWFRITMLKRLAYDELTQEEERLLCTIKGCSLCVPEPFMFQLRMFGRIQTLTGEHLRSEFPPLPTEVIEGFGGYYGPISADTHNLYEEIPCLGVTSESVRHSISNDPPGRYHSSLERLADNIIPNENLLGFKPLGARRAEAKNLAFDAGITSEEFPVSLPNTGINLRFIYSISDILAQTKAFKTTLLDITTMAESGSITQAIMQKPIPATGTTQKRGEIYSFANFSDQDFLGAYGLGLVYTPNLFKEGLTPGLVAEWCCINTPPVEYINNRNDRRDTIPLRYREEVFSSSTQSGQQYRQIMVRMMVTTKW